MRRKLFIAAEVALVLVGIVFRDRIVDTIRDAADTMGGYDAGLRLLVADVAEKNQSLLLEQEFPHDFKIIAQNTLIDLYQEKYLVALKKGLRLAYCAQYAQTAAHWTSPVPDMEIFEDRNLPIYYGHSIDDPNVPCKYLSPSEVEPGQIVRVRHVGFKQQAKGFPPDLALSVEGGIVVERSGQSNELGRANWVFTALGYGYDARLAALWMKPFDTLQEAQNFSSVLGRPGTLP
jgi:hypothetical protein